MRLIKTSIIILLVMLIVASCTPTEMTSIDEKCVELSSTLDTRIDGVVVLQDQVTEIVSLYDLRTYHETLLDKASFVMATSPDASRLAYTKEEASKKFSGNLVVVNSDATKVFDIEVPENWIGVIRWNEPDSLLIEKFIQQPYQLANSIAYNLDTGTSEEYLSNYPGITHSIPLLGWGNYTYSRAVYDPSFSRVVYRGSDTSGAETILALYSVDSRNEIARFHQGDYLMGGAPQWSRDGQYFIAGIYPQHQVGDTLYKNVTDDFPYQGGYELFRVNRDGKVQRLTHLTTKYQAGEEAFSLSPDEKQIAFWLNLNYEAGDLNADRKLAILDVATGEITNLCLAGGASPYPPIWSPDGNYLAVSRYYVAGNILSDVVFVDLKQGDATKIDENTIATGWLVK